MLHEALVLFSLVTAIYETLKIRIRLGSFA